MPVLWLAVEYPYLLRSLKMAYRSRRLGPAIHEHQAFANDVIQATSPQSWSRHPEYNQVQLTDWQKTVQESIGTTALLVIRDGKLLHETYWQPQDGHVPTNSFSVAKSYVGTLVGIAIEEGLLNWETRVGDLLPSFAEPDKASINVWHLMSMSSGLKWIESEGNPFSHNARAYYGSDLRKMVDQLTVHQPPGEAVEYVSINSQVLALLLEEATGRPLVTYLSEKLWTPLQAEDTAYWNKDREDGVVKAFCCLYASPLDFARLGQLYLDDGKWNGKQILSKAFVRRCTQAVDLPYPWVKRHNTIYGLHWWLVEHKGEKYFYARGIRGQYIIVNRSEKMVIVRTGHKRNPVDSHLGHPPDLFDHIDAGMEITLKSCPQ